MNPKKLMEIRINKDWKNPQELIVQHLIFDELKEIDEKNDYVGVTMQNRKTGFKIELTLHPTIIYAILNRPGKDKAISLK